MTDSYGFKVLSGLSSGKTVLTAGIDDLLLHSDYTMFKNYNTYTATCTFNPGDTVKTVSVTHNLGYVPAFIPYVKNLGNIQLAEESDFIIPSIPYGISEFDTVSCYADTTKIYFEYRYFSYFDTYGMSFGSTTGGFNEFMLTPANMYNATAANYTSIRVGRHPTDTRDNAIRFSTTLGDVTVPITSSSDIDSVSLEYNVTAKGTGTGDVKFRKVGMDEDNTASWTTGDYPMGRPETTASAYQTQSCSAGVPFNFGIDLKDQTSEIVDRAGWSEGNALGYYLYTHTDTPNNTSLYTSITDDSYLRIRVAGTQDVYFKVIVFKDKIA